MSRLSRSLPIMGLCVCALLAAPERVVAETRNVKDWKVTCDGGNCAAHHDSQGVQLVVAVPENTGQKRFLLRVNPLAGVGEPVAIRLNDGWSAALAVSSCSERTCQATVRVESNAQVEEAFKRASNGVVAYRVGTTMVIAPISLAGFTEAVTAVR